VVVPAWYVPRRAYTVEVIGAVLLGSARKTPLAALAERVGVPAATAARWLRSARHQAASVIRHASDVGGPAVRVYRSPASWLGSDLAETLDALGDAARAFSHALRPVLGRGRSRGGRGTAEQPQVHRLHGLQPAEEPAPGPGRGR
jgi:type IV secretory pathway TrbL component